MIFLALILIITGIFLAVRKIKIVKKSVIIYGVVIDILSSISDDTETFKPLISYSVRSGGEEFTYSPNASYSRCRYKIGDKVPLLCNSEVGIIEGIMAVDYLFLFPYIFFGLGAVIFGYKLLVFFENAIFNFIRG